ncbi:MAG: metal ABC transporter permease [Gemmatimonadaceae bacterium]|nr:metal ABC transporter permease [Gemmatimonadaceae bacterium]
MSTIDIEIQLIAVVVAVSCALPGVYLVLRRMAMMSDAISHTVLLGIVLAFFVTGDIASPLLIIAAAATGMLTVTLVESVRGTRLVTQDAAIGLVFPALFSIAVILISRYAGDVHLDTDAVLLGELAFAPFTRLEVGGVDLGPKTLYVMGGVLLLNVGFIITFYKELKLTTFDAALAASLGFSPVLLHYAFMGLVSVTAVGAFDAVGSVLVVALMIVPPAGAYLLTEKLRWMIVLSALLGASSALAGYWVAWVADASIAGSIASVTGAQFLLIFLLAPERGVIAQSMRRARQRVEFAQLMLAIHLLNHEGTPEAERESRESELHEHLRWSPKFVARIVRLAEREELIEREAGGLRLTPAGRAVARSAIAA